MSILANFERFDKDGIELIIDTATGKSFATAKGYARMSGKDYDTIKKRCQRGGLESAEIPTEQGFKRGTLIPESLIVEWLPKDNPVMATQIMQLGVRVFMHKLAGYEVTTTAIAHNLPKTYLDALKCLVASEEQKALLTAKIEKDAPLVEYAEAVQCSDTDIDFNTFAKMIGTGRTRLFRALRDLGVIMQNSTLPYQKWMDAGYFEACQEITGDGKLRPFAVITGKGQIWLKQKLGTLFAKPKTSISTLFDMDSY